MSYPIQHALFEPWFLAGLRLNNRIIAAPMTRQRASLNGCPSPIMEQYYEQRSDVGLIITEGTYVRDTGIGYCRQPGATTAEQLEGWRALIDRVHCAGGKIVVQLMDAGARSVPELCKGETPLGPSSSRSLGHKLPNSRGHIQCFEEASIEQIENIQKQTVLCAKNLVEVGADGIEIHAGTGYLFHEFIDRNLNLRTDTYGSDWEGRTKLLFEVLQDIKSENSEALLGVRLSPDFPPFSNPGGDEKLHDDYLRLFCGLKPSLVDYISLISGDIPHKILTQYVESSNVPVLIGSPRSYGETDVKSAMSLLDSGLGSAVVVGRQVAANPGIVKKWQNGEYLNKIKYDYLYQGGEKGYIDYE